MDLHVVQMNFERDDNALFPLLTFLTFLTAACTLRWWCWSYNVGLTVLQWLPTPARCGTNRVCQSNTHTFWRSSAGRNLTADRCVLAD